MRASSASALRETCSASWPAVTKSRRGVRWTRKPRVRGGRRSDAYGPNAPCPSRSSGDKSANASKRGNWLSPFAACFAKAWAFHKLGRRSFGPSGSCPRASSHRRGEMDRRTAEDLIDGRLSWPQLKEPLFHSNAPDPLQVV